MAYKIRARKAGVCVSTDPRHLIAQKRVRMEEFRVAHAEEKSHKLNKAIEIKLGPFKFASVFRRCEEKLRLLTKYQKAVHLYKTHVDLMREMASGLLPMDEFALLSKVATRAHEKCAEARECFYKHIEEHGC